MATTISDVRACDNFSAQFNSMLSTSSSLSTMSFFTRAGTSVESDEHEPQPSSFPLPLLSPLHPSLLLKSLASLSEKEHHFGSLSPLSPLTPLENVMDVDIDYDSDPDIPLSLSCPNWQAMKKNASLQGTLEILATNFDPSLLENKKFPISRQDKIARDIFTQAQRKAASQRFYPGSFTEMKHVVSKTFFVSQFLNAKS